MASSIRVRSMMMMEMSMAMPMRFSAPASEKIAS